MNTGVLVVVLVAVIAVWWSALRTILSDATPPPVVGQPRALAWGDRVFANKAQLRAWLRKRGIRYEAWARHHAGAIAIVEHRPMPITAPEKTHTVAAAAHTKATKPATVASRAEKHSTTGGNHLLAYLTWGLAALLAAAAIAPRHWYARLQYQAASPVRTYVAVAACAVTLGSLVARI